MTFTNNYLLTKTNLETFKSQDPNYKITVDTVMKGEDLYLALVNAGYEVDKQRLTSKDVNHSGFIWTLSPDDPHRVWVKRITAKTSTIENISSFSKRKGRYGYVEDTI